MNAAVEGAPTVLGELRDNRSVAVLMELRIPVDRALLPLFLLPLAVPAPVKADVAASQLIYLLHVPDLAR